MAINNFNVGVGTTSQLTRYRYVATGGETSISGTDADGKTLSYTVGLEQVFLNGVNLVRGQDYTATNGTSVGALTALVASDVVEVFAYVPFNIANALTVSTVDAKGDLLVGTADNTIGKLTAGINGQVLTAASGETTGLKWVNPGMVLVKSQTIGTTVSSVAVTDAFSADFDNYKILVHGGTASTGNNFAMTLGASATGYYSGLTGTVWATNAAQNTGQNNATSWLRVGVHSTGASVNIDIQNPFNANYTYFQASFGANTYSSFIAGVHQVATSYTDFTFTASTGTWTGGVISVYGYNK